MSNAEKAQRLTEQINKRYELLKAIKAGSISGIELPKSLNKLREWNNQKLGIERIGSPSSFTTNHKLHGNTIKRIDSLLKELLKPRKPRRKTTKTELKRVNNNLDAALQNAANKYVQYASEIERLKVETALLKSKEQGLEEEIAELKSALNVAREENLALRKKLIQYESKPRSKVTRLDFGMGDLNAD